MRLPSTGREYVLTTFSVRVVVLPWSSSLTTLDSVTL